MKKSELKKLIKEEVIKEENQKKLEKWIEDLETFNKFF